MKVLLIQPPPNSKTIGIESIFLNEPLALETIAAGIPHHEVSLLDMRLNRDLEHQLDTFQPDIVATTAYTVEVYTVNSILQKVKEYNRNILTVVGGHHATMVPEDFNKKFIDAIVIGEGEITFQELVNTYEKGESFRKIDGLALPQEGTLLFNRARKAIADLDKSPFPNRDLTKEYRNHYARGKWRPLASMMTSRGCPFKCDFCAMWKINRGKYRLRSPESVVEELITIEEKYIDFADDNTLHDLKRAERIYHLIKEKDIKKIYKLYARSDAVVRRPDIIEKWKEIGMDLILIGFESFRDKELQARNKRNTIRNNEEAIHILQENGVEIAAYFLIDPNYTKGDFDALGDYVVKMNLIHPVFTVLTPFPGTDLFEKRYDDLVTHNYEKFDFFHSLFPTKLPLKEFYHYFINLYRRVYTFCDNGKEKNSLLSEEMLDQFYSRLITTHNL